MNLKALISIILGGMLFFPGMGLCETYGIKDPQGNFVPKVTVTIEPKEILIRKTDPREKFQSISLTLNVRNRNLVKNVGLLKIQWIGEQDRPGRELPFAGPRFTPQTRVFKDSMAKSVALKILDGSVRDLFKGKEFADLFSLHIDDQPCISSESFFETDRTVRLGPGRDISIDVDKEAVVFSDRNIETGEMITVDNRSGNNQSLGVVLPQTGLDHVQIVRRPEQTKVPRESWERFTVKADSGIFIVLTPKDDPSHLDLLNGKEIVIKVWDADKVKQIHKIPIKISSELLTTGPASGRRRPPPPPVDRPVGTSEPPSVAPSHEAQPVAKPAREPLNATPSRLGGIWPWAFVIFNLVLAVGLWAYVTLVILSKVQVLEDRLAKNEMFIHGSREAIRDELEEIKADILRQCLEKPPPE